MSYYYGRGLGRVKDRELAILNDMVQLLSRARYKRSTEYAARLYKEGMTLEELRWLLKGNPAALKRSHGFERWQNETLPKYKPGPFVGAESVYKDYLRLAKHYLKSAKSTERSIQKEKPTGRLLKEWRREIAHKRALARRALEKAKRHRGVYSRDSHRSRVSRHRKRR